MTQHWDVKYGCAGCDYLLKYGMPQEFVNKDHRDEVARLRESKPVVVVDLTRPTHKSGVPIRKPRVPLFACMECLHKFYTLRAAERASIGDAGCPGCGGLDIEQYGPWYEAERLKRRRAHTNPSVEEGFDQMETDSGQFPRDSED